MILKEGAAPSERFSGTITGVWDLGKKSNITTWNGSGRYCKGFYNKPKNPVVIQVELPKSKNYM